MYYEEKVINNVLCRRFKPNGEWYPFTIVELTKRIIELQKMNIKEAL